MGGTSFIKGMKNESKVLIGVIFYIFEILKLGKYDLSVDILISLLMKYVVILVVVVLCVLEVFKY